MPRKGPAPKRPIDVDPVYGSQLVSQLVSKVLQDGKKQVAQRIVYGIEVKGTRGTTLALRWLVGYAQDRREKTMSERLMNEILDASNGLGAAVKKREDTHKMAESNKAFAHYRW